MPCFDASSAQCVVFTQKEGLLSPIAHDLRIAVTRFSVDVDFEKRTLSADFDAASLRVETAMRDGKEAPDLLSASDYRKIEHNIATDVLDAATYPRITFVSTAIEPAGEGRFAVVGRLTLHGRSRELRMATRRAENRHIAEVTLHQPDYGIKPYTALLGTLRVRADVVVRLSLPAG